MSDTVNLANIRRTAVRQALRSHAGIDAVIAENVSKGLIRPDKTRINDMSTAELNSLCAIVGLNPRAIGDQAEQALQAPRATAPAVSREAQDIMDASEQIAAVLERQSDDAPAPSEDAAHLAAEALSPLNPYRAMLHPTMIAELESAVSNLATLAAKPPVVVHVPAPSQGAPGAAVLPFPAPVAPVARPRLPEARRVRTESVGTAFGLSNRGAWGKLSVAIWNAPDAPKADDDYVWEPNLLMDMVTSVERGRSVWLYGPKGTGKTSAVQQYAARTGRPFVRIGCRPDMESVELVGMNALQNGLTVFKPGTLVRAVARPGTIVLLDEPTLATRVHALFQTLLDFGFITVHEDEGEVVRIADGVVFVACDNTNGTGDTTGNYTGTGQSNAAFLNRFAKFIPVGFLPVAQEAKAIASRANVPAPVGTRLALWASRTRQGAVNGELTEGVSLRNLVYFAEALSDGIEAERAFQVTVLNAASPADATVLEALRRSDLDLSALTRDLTGAPAPAPSQDVSANAATTKAQNIFDTLS